MRVICRMKGADAARHWLCQRCLIVCASLVLQQASQFHNLGRNDTVCCITAKELIRVSRAPHGSLVVQRRLKCELHARLKLVLMVLADLNNVTRKLVSHDCRMLCDILVYTLVVCTQYSTLIRRHTDAVGYYFDENLVIGNLRKLKFLQSQVVCRMQSYASCFHSKNSFRYCFKTKCLYFNSSCFYNIRISPKCQCIFRRKSAQFFSEIFGIKANCFRNNSFRTKQRASMRKPSLHMDALFLMDLSIG